MASEAPKEPLKVAVKRVNLWLSDDKDELTISFGGRDDATLVAPTEQLDEMLKVLGDWRGEMKPPHLESYVPVPHVAAIDNPAWYTEPEISMGGTLLHIRHPGFGWLSFYLRPANRDKLSHLLQEQIEQSKKP
jgi:hypothetical protein